MTSETLADYLEKAVPLESGETVGANVQAPEVSAAWRSPKDIYLELTAPVAGGQPRIWDRLEKRRVQDLKTVSKPSHDFSDIEEFSKSRPSEYFRAQKSQFSNQALETVAKAERRNERAAKENEALFAASQGREGFETGHGVTLIGCEAVEVTVRRGEQATLFRQRSKSNIRGHGEKPLSVLIELENGNWIAGCILPEFVGTIVVKGGLAASLSYAPAGYSNFPRESFEHISPLLNRWTALMHQGRFGDYKELEQIADQFHKYKHINPSLGIIAAYAYERRGDLSEIDKVASYFAQARQPVPFDVALLSTKPVRRTQQGLTVELDAGRRAVAGSFPLMTQGWSFLDREDDFVPSVLFEVRAGLLPALWTTFRGKEGRKLSELLYQGEI